VSFELELHWIYTGGYHDSVEMQLIHIFLEGFLLILVLYRYSFKIDFLCHLSCTGYILADIMTVLRCSRLICY
jgi:hypothetical protein